MPKKSVRVARRGGITTVSTSDPFVDLRNQPIARPQWPTLVPGALIDLEVIRCDDCGNLGVSIGHRENGGLRLTPHKCSGSWTGVSAHRMEATKLLADIDRGLEMVFPPERDS